MVSLSDDSNGVQRKNKFLPQLVRRLGIGRNKTIIKPGTAQDSEDEVCLRKKMVSFDDDDDGVGDEAVDRPTSLPLLIRHGDKRQSVDAGREEKAISLGSEGAARLTSILKQPGSQVYVVEDGRELFIRGKVNGKPLEEGTNSSGNESSSSPFRRGSSFRQSFNYLFKRNRLKLKDRSCTSDSDSNAVLELDEENSCANTPNKPLLDAFLPEKVPSKRASTGDIFDDIVIQLNEDFGVKNKAKSHRRMHSDSMYFSVVSSAATGTDR